MDIHEKIANLIRLAKRPGTKHEGAVAREMAIRLSLKYLIPCEFTGAPPEPEPEPQRPRASKKPPKPKPKPTDDDKIQEWIKALKEYGWTINSTIVTVVGRQLRFRKPEFDSEIRITQRKGGCDFEAEHIKCPDPAADGRDWSTTVFMTTHLRELLRHIEYTKFQSPDVNSV